jgi:phospholipid/cholesterol/gamma-HCH transport system ATP-binding protein
MSGEELIRLDDVAVQSPPDTPAVALSGIDWTLRSGEFWIVGGLNWSGKTDWLATAAGLLKPEGGQQTIFGKDRASMGAAELLATRMRIGFVFEHTGRLFTDLNVAENIALPLSYHRNCTAEHVLDDVRAILDACGLSEIATHNPNDLSRGMRRRVALARALAIEPEILMIDSPLTSMDPVQTRWWIDFLATLQKGSDLPFKRPSTFVITVEDFRHWLAADRRFALLQRGGFKILGAAEAVAESTEPQVREMLTGDI